MRGRLSMAIMTIALTVVGIGLTAEPAHANVFVSKVVALHSGRCMDVSGPQHMANAFQQTCWDSLSQRWEFRRLDDGAYVLVNRYSGRCLDVAWVDPNPGADILQSGCWNGPNQQWLIRSI